MLLWETRISVRINLSLKWSLLFQCVYVGTSSVLVSRATQINSKHTRKRQRVGIISRIPFPRGTLNPRIVIYDNWRFVSASSSFRSLPSPPSAFSAVLKSKFGELSHRRKRLICSPGDSIELREIKFYKGRRFEDRDVFQERGWKRCYWKRNVDNIFRHGWFYFEI